MTEELVVQLINERNWKEALGLNVHPEQQRFVADLAPIAAVGLAKAFVRPAGMLWLPYVVYAGSTMVGFFNIAFKEKEKEDSWLFHFFIDHRFQGRGYGLQAVHRMIEVARTVHPEGMGVSLVVHPENVAAMHLYRSIGFQATGEIKWNEPVYRFEL